MRTVSATEGLAQVLIAKFAVQRPVTLSSLQQRITLQCRSPAVIRCRGAAQARGHLHPGWLHAERRCLQGEGLTCIPNQDKH
jgi:hypothetical protein